MTHDLMRNLLDALGARVARVVVTEVRDTTYFAEIHLDMGDRASRSRAGPSDAIALAARTHSPLFVADELMESEGILVASDEDEEGEATSNPDELVGEFKEFLDQVKPEDFTP